MKKDLLSFNAQVGIGIDFLSKIKLVFVLLFSFFIIPFSAQEIKSEEDLNSQVVITVIDDAFIYSKDEAFNKQVSNNKDLQEHSTIEISQDHGLKISAKTSIQFSPKESEKKKPTNIVLASKKSDQYKPVDLPKKAVEIIIRNGAEGDQFLLGSNASGSSFVTPSNDLLTSKYFLIYTDKLVKVSLLFSYFVNYFYQNNNSKSQVFHNDYSVRPPPSLI
ncbi:hypothetical protein PQ459_06760 [Chryseobacterium sp. KACC 21268]|nr:hypothetical protein PQ459_06760 [Chryseobacterium sp. KACC 21268]